MIWKIFFFAFLAVVKAQTVDTDVKHQYRIIEKCRLDEGLKQLLEFSNKQCNECIKKKILEFIDKARAIPLEQITNEKYDTAEILVRSAIAGLKVDTYTDEQKIRALDGMMEVFKMFNTTKPKNQD